MNGALPHSRKAAATAESIETLVDLLVSHIQDAYATAEQPGALAAVREIFGKMDHASLAALVDELGLEIEPVREDRAEERRAPGAE
jgi:hypothetical protein